MIIPSLNAGAKKYEILRDTAGYHSREAMLKGLYRKYGPEASMYDVYEELQGLDRSVSTGLDEDRFHELKEIAGIMPDKWKDCIVSTGRDKWWKFSVESADPATPWLRDLALIKVYVSVDEPSCVMEIFSRTVKMLLEQSDNRFHAKVSRMKRKDSMCFWVSRYSYFLLEKFFEEEKHVIAGTLPFIAYRGKLGISRELVTFDSHNSVQALLISRYFRTVGNLADVDLGEMYSLMMQAWNGDLPDKHPLSEALRYERAQTILLLLDTMDLLTGKTVFTDDHFLLQENGCLWHALGMASSWEKAEKEYHAELQMQNSMLKNE